MQKSSLTYYNTAKLSVMDGPWAHEILHQKSIFPEHVSERTFLCETAWVILNSGFRETVVRKLFPYVSLCFFDWRCAELIATDRENAIRLSANAFRNVQKLTAIADVATLVSAEGFAAYWERVRKTPIENLQKLPFIGPITVMHLAKNLGFAVSKPDRHLVRLAKQLGYDCPMLLCRDISTESGDTEDVVDAVLWRFQASHAPYLNSH